MAETIFDLKHVSVIRCATVVAVIAAILGFIEAFFFIPFFTVMSNMPGGNGLPDGIKPVLGLFAFVVLPIGFAVGGFIEGLIGAFLYNVTVRWHQGFQFTLSTVAPESAPYL